MMMMMTASDHNPKEADEPATRTPPQPHSADLFHLFVWFFFFSAGGSFLVVAFLKLTPSFVGSIPPRPEDSFAILC
jgi:hypothetical protein